MGTTPVGRFVLPRVEVDVQWKNQYIINIISIGVMKLNFTATVIIIYTIIYIIYSTTFQF